MPKTIATLFNKTALPHDQQANNHCLCHCAGLVPTVTGRFSTRATEFFARFLGACYSLRFLGREKGVCDKLRRHPLIDPIFRPHYSPRRRGKALSISLARQNLHLVIPSKAGPSRFISVIQLLTAAILHVHGCFVKHKIRLPTWNKYGKRSIRIVWVKMVIEKGIVFG